MKETFTQLLPHTNAVLNCTATILLIAGYVAVRTKRVSLHKKMMLSAFLCSALFLGSYVSHKILVGGTTHFREDLPTIRLIYLAILVPHFLLAILVVPLACTTIFFGVTDRIHRHRRVARVTLPIWLFVSVTGVIVYLMLYQIWPPQG